MLHVFHAPKSDHDMPGRPYVLQEAAFKVLRSEHCEVAVLPWGATEAHNYHLPYGTDSIQAEAIANEAARISWEDDARVIVLPTIPFGANAQQLNSNLTINLHPSTQAKILEDVVESLQHHLVPKLVVLNGHGGNDFRQMIRELQSRVDVFLCTVNWYTMLQLADFFEEPGDHAGEMETSLMLHLAPELPHPLAEAGPGRARVFRIRALREKWAWAPRDWKQVTPDTGVGDPKAASAPKGERYFRAVTQKLASFLKELAHADTNDLYVDDGS